MPALLLLDNGSTRPSSTLSLRRLAAALARRIGEPVHPVSLLHADQVPAVAVGGQPADTLVPFLTRRLREGDRDFRAVPLFFGPSRALTAFVPDSVAALTAETGVSVRLDLARELCPLPEGEPRLVDILADQVRATAARAGIPARRVVLVDHGSPIPEVSAVRSWLAARLAARLGPGVRVEEAAMERRADASYDFNGALLAARLGELARADPATPVILAMLFLSPGRHAGPGGDIAAIRAAVAAEHPGFRVLPSPLVGAHPGLLDILEMRVRALRAPPGRILT